MLEVRLLDQPVSPVSYVPLEPFPQPAGAECIFIGRTRAEEHPAHGPLIRLEYEAYRGMAQRVLTELAHAAVEQFDCLAVRIHHAVGSVPVGAASVLVQVACGRRDASFLACRFLIDQIKATAPIWKREVWSDGATWSAGQPVAEAEASA